MRRGKRRRERRRLGALVARMGKVVQRRDIVHNVDRPRSAVQYLSEGQAKAMVRDVKDFIVILDGHLDQHRLW
jgi:hypothetical protein